jgi:hypothetical protein
MNKKPLLSIVFLLFIFSWVLPNTSYAQLDSTVATISVVENYYESTDSLDQQNMAVLVLTFDDISDVGHISIVVYDNETNNVFVELSKTREEWNTAGFLFSDRVECPLFQPFPEQHYRIEISPMNIAGAYTKGCIITLDN